MIEIAICDDEIIITSKIENTLVQLSEEMGIKVEIDVFYDGKTLVNYIKSGKKYDLIYMDIEMTEQNGISAANEIREIDKKVFLIYITSYESFAKDVFEVNAYRFITKPIDWKFFRKCFEAVKDELTVQPHYFRYQYNKVVYRVSLDEIMYFQSDRRVTYIITEKGSKKCYGKLNDIERRLLDSNIVFFRIHQSFLVNPQYVIAYFYDSIELLDGTILSISENRRKKVSALFCTLKGEDIIV
ncbi:LytR/AlgR family response regulator transcription factor [Mediterraneibacter gnavus]|uniref:Stage 0 sporulation protein A homolog n=1 Tax=Mediterraneibacter gnavus TaxID=33038 RepID=A0AAJ3FGD9_MEDGN|nr:LytTR family DNA-binding domain-containing protein [Mediterraneibacter gnavus]MBS6170882.1 response regulator transcription factor [Clostridiales bacterium]MDU4755386.1 LytTR family DNA-binding domain-containing protein [Lachnospiraceae bacterium]NSC84527.1 response regulator transcription factor [Mediterraneibacter gnavus]NSI27415.1 response regulator transcription factor [Mediterraneibacter gnavus]NSI30894.1 response regulator transcription factor [Mediterraneibacter gnavus]